MGNRPLTWQQMVAVLLGFVVLVFGILAFAGDMPAEARPVGYLGLAIFVPLLLGMLYWHWRAGHRPDVYPDVVGQMAQAGDVLEAGGVHLLVKALFLEGQARLLVVAQNTRDGAGCLELRFSGKKEVPLVPALHLELGPAGVAAAVTDLDLAGLAGREVVWDLAADGRTRGRRVRFRRYVAVAKKVHPIVMLLALLGGHMIWGGGTTYRVSVPPAFAASPARARRRMGWQAEAVWTLEAQASIEQLQGAISRMMEEEGAAADAVLRG